MKQFRFLTSIILIIAICNLYSCSTKNGQNTSNTLPWFYTLSSSGEKIKLVETLNKQVLATDQKFLEAINAENKNLISLFEMISPSDKEVHKKYALQKLNDIENHRNEIEKHKKEIKKLEEKIKISVGEHAELPASEESRDELDIIHNDLKEKEIDEIELVKKQNQLKSKKKEIDEIESKLKNAESDLLNIVSELIADPSLVREVMKSNISRVGQRFTLYNMRPAAVVAAERDGGEYSKSESKFLNSLDLTQVAVVAGATIEPVVIALGIIDSIAKRVIKKDGDTEMTYFSLPIPYNFEIDDHGFVKRNRAQIVASNNGKYEFHFNGENIKSAIDTVGPAPGSKPDPAGNANPEEEQAEPDMVVESKYIESKLLAETAETLKNDTSSKSSEIDKNKTLTEEKYSNSKIKVDLATDKLKEASEAADDPIKEQKVQETLSLVEESQSLLAKTLTSCESTLKTINEITENNSKVGKIKEQANQAQNKANSIVGPEEMALLKANEDLKTATDIVIDLEVSGADAEKIAAAKKEKDKAALKVVSVQHAFTKSNEKRASLFAIDPTAKKKYEKNVELVSLIKKESEKIGLANSAITKYAENAVAIRDVFGKIKGNSIGLKNKAEAIKIDAEKLLK